MSSNFVRIGLARVGLVGSLCILAAGCSSDASLGGQHEEQDADEHDTGDGGSSSGVEQSASTGSHSTASSSSGSVQTASASNVNGTGGSVTSVGGAGGTAAGGSVGVGGSGAGGDNATGGGPSGGGSTTEGNTTGGTGGTDGGTAGSGGSGANTGTGSADCEMYQCARPFECVESCGGPILKSSCCFCDPGTFDRIQCPIADCASSADCESDEYCYFEGETCGEDGSLGTCRGRILFCPAVIIPTCGCDLVIYDSECAAAYAGVSVTAFDRCAED